MSDITNELAITQEISTLEEQMRYANDLRANIAKATNELANGYIGLINAKDEFQRIKKDNIDEIRRYKFAISAEVKEVESDLKRLAGFVSKERLAQLKEFADVCERLELLRSAEFFSAVRITS